MPFAITVFQAAFRALANTFTLVVVGLSAALFAAGLHGDAVFLLSTITANAVVSIVQEVRAKALLRKLELLNAPTATVARHGKQVEVSVAELRVGDHVALVRGDQVPADGVVLKANGLFVNQALLTGEADEIQIYSHHPVYAGSFVVGGSGTFRVTAIGKATTAGGMAAKLKWYDAKLTPLQRTLGRIIRWLSYASIILAILIYLDGQRSGQEIAETLGTVASGAVSIVPEGLLLATTLLFAYGAVQMGKREVLIQRIGAIEGFSRLQTLCLDKTGTLTENGLALGSVSILGNYGDADLRAYMGYLLSTGESPTPTTEALADYRPKDPLKPFDFIPFSSSRKLSAVLIPEHGLHRAVALGAPDVLDDRCELTAEQTAWIRERSRLGERILLLADFGTTRTALSAAIERKGSPVALISLKHVLRQDAVDTVFYLQANGVGLKVISGDSKETVQAVAHQVGIRHWRKALTGDQLADLDPDQWEERIPETTIFARVLPEQKERIIATLRKHGFTGMVGDGVNDTLALKEADLGISFKEGSQAARHVADAVLLDNRFAAIPLGMQLGAKVVFGVQMVACLFFNKIAVGSSVLALSYLLDMPYPLSTRYLFLLNLVTIGMPTLLWSLFPARPASGKREERWLIPVLRFSLVNGMITAVAIMSAYITANLLPTGAYGPETVGLYVALILGIFTVWLIPRFLGAVRDKTLRVYPAIYTVGALLLIFLGGQRQSAEELFLIANLDASHFLVVVAASLAAAGIMHRLSSRPVRYVIGEEG